MTTLKSKDGTAIAFDKQGDGPAVILVDETLSTRSFGSQTRARQASRPAIYRL